MTWTAHHRRGDVARLVIETANSRRDGMLPMELPGVADTFHNDLDLVSELQLRWHTHLAGEIERLESEQPEDLDVAVIQAWRNTRAELPGIRDILDRYGAQPTSEAMAKALRKSRFKDRVLMAVMAGLASELDSGAERVGTRLEQEARRQLAAASPVPGQRGRQASLLERLKAVLAA